jgi:hypothetical protein
MAKRAKISEIAGEIEMQMDETCSYFDRETGKVVSVRDEDLSAAEDGDVPDPVGDWEREMVELAGQIIEDEDGKRFVELPDKSDVDEWRLMERFVDSMDDEATRDRLLRAIHGSGAFRRFKDRIHELNVADGWYEFRKARYQEIARRWCDDNGIEISPEDA